MATVTKIDTQAEIKRRNSIFKKATSAEKRVLIAKDVLELIKAKKIVPTSGKWVDFYTQKEYYAVEDKSFREAVLEGDIEACDCCALGSIMTSCTLFKNKVTVGEAFDGEALSYDAISEGYVEDKIGLLKLFGRKQLALIEIAFEEGSGYHEVEYILGDIVDGYYGRMKEATTDIRHATRTKDITVKEVEAAHKFGCRYNDEEERLVAIMKNIIKNKGTFVP